MNILIFLIILLVLVLVHEAGHFFVAKFFGIRVDEFGFGFPPKLFSIKKGETKYSFNALPFGGFVKIFGEDPNDENTNGPDAKRSFVNKPAYQQALVLFAGVFMNFILAWVLFSFGFMSGLPTSASTQQKDYIIQDQHLVVLSVVPASPAELAGLKAGDKIMSIIIGDDVEEAAPSIETFQNFVGSSEKLGINYMRGNELKNTEVFPKKNSLSQKFVIGISMDEIGIAKLPVYKAFWEGLKLDIFVTKGTVKGLYSLVADSLQGKGNLSAVTGPVGLVSVVGDAYKFGWAYLLSFAALISVNLAIINLIPFPALDGGRLLFLLIEKIKGSRINPKFANTANMIGFGILILLMVVVTYHDVVKLF
ncbi:site-2 protease family protein [Candidatus Nomurabacteria bacterium]|nr:site-2 protease family protein [Candidatus Nomurabacteria bacterium]